MLLSIVCNQYEIFYCLLHLNNFKCGAKLQTGQSTAMWPSSNIGKHQSSLDTTMGINSLSQLHQNTQHYKCQCLHIELFYLHKWICKELSVKWFQSSWNIILTSKILFLLKLYTCIIILSCWKFGPLSLFMPYKCADQQSNAATCCLSKLPDAVVRCVHFI